MSNTNLTVRQITTLERLAAGRTNKGAALDMGTTELGVQEQKRIIFRKLDVHTSAHAVAEGFRKGLLK